MSLIEDRKARLTAAAFAQWGVPALWNGQLVTVIERSEDQDIPIANFGPAEVRGDRVMVRQSEISVPARSDMVTINPGTPEQRIVAVFSEPKLSRTGIWTCEVTS